MKRLDLITNCAVILTSIVLLGFLGDTWHQNHRASQSSSTRAKALAGRTIQLPGVDFTQKGKTLVIAISSTCHFCEESRPFYKQLANMQIHTAELITVLPMPQKEAEDYVHTTISSSYRVVSSSLATIGVYTTPTLLLVDSQGKVEKAWVGKLSNVDQAKVQSQLLPSAYTQDVVTKPN